MSSIYYGLSMIAIFVIIFWFVRNDRIAPDEPSKGILAMKQSVADKDSGKDLGKDASPGA